MRVLQVLPELNSGGVERGTVEFANYLVSHGHESLVISAGGRMVEQLESQGSRHYRFPVHHKSLLSLAKVRPLRRLIDELAPDIIHVRSRMPAWLVWLALGRRPLSQRPGLVSTFHGMYSVNAYSAIMGRGDRVIAISECVRDYIVNSYPKLDTTKITVVHRGVDRASFPPTFEATESWKKEFFAHNPSLVGKPLVLMPGRLSRWKGQLQFIELMSALKAQGSNAHGLILGGITPGKEDYEMELKQKAHNLGLDDRVTFLGHRSDIENFYSISQLVLNLSQRPEPFGRTVIESLAVGTPVVALDIGGPAESLKKCFPEGLVPVGDTKALVKKVVELLDSPGIANLDEEFTLAVQAEKTLRVYEQVLNIKKVQ